VFDDAELAREARSNEEDVMSALTTLVGATAGAALMYAFDPVAGTRRRADVPDESLEERIRATLGTLVRYPRLVQVRAENGRVTLAGAVASDEVGRLVRRVRRIGAVAAVDNQLGLRADPAELPGAQPPIPPRPPGPAMADLFRYAWSPSVRAAATAVGTGLVLHGIRRGGIRAVFLGASGAFVLLGALNDAPLASRARPAPEC
jgi:hypothetical protein